MNAVVSSRTPAKNTSAKKVAPKAPQKAAKPAAKKVSRPAAKATKPVATPKPSVKPAVKPSAKPVKAVKPAKPAAPLAASASNGKQKLVRDSFTMPSHDFGLIHTLKERTLGFRRPTKKSELLRAGLHALAALGDAQLRTVLDGLTPLKSGRPKKAG
jgi:hypothetical protein